MDDGRPQAEYALTRRALLRGGVAGLMALALPGRVRAALGLEDAGSSIAVSNGSVPFAGDGPLLATLSPGGHRGRERAVVRFRLPRRATVRPDVIDRNAPGEGTIVHEQQGTVSEKALHTQEVELGAGVHELAWAPPIGQAPGTYTMAVSASDHMGTRRIAGGRGPKYP